MTPPYRALCAELVELSAPTDSIYQLTERLQKLSELANRARTALAQPVAPTVKESLTTPTGSLVERVFDALYDAPDVSYSPARAAILEVAAWFRTERDSPETAAALEQEANR
jgi:hypothetical protein